jgi:peroxiredoxin
MKKQLSLLLATVLGMGAVCAVSVRGFAQEASKAVQTAPADKAVIGKPFKNFALVNIASEKKETISLASFKGKKAVVGVFMANRCGTTWQYEGKIGKLIKDYGKKDVQIMAIHSNFTEPDGEIVGQMEQRNLAIPILDDKAKQELADYVGARVTPTFFVLDKEGVLRYIGSFDDYGAEPAYVPNALDAVLAGKKPAKESTRAFG